MSALLGLLGASLMLPGASIALPRGVLAAYDFSRTNLFNYSEDFANAAWGKVRASVSGGKFVQDTTANATHELRWQFGGTVADGSSLTFFADMSMAELRYVHLQIATKSGLYPRASFDLQTGASQVVANPSAIGAIGVVDLGGGIKRCWITVTSVSTGANPVVAHLMLATDMATTGYSFTGDGVSGIFVYRAQASILPTLNYERVTDGQAIVDRSVRLGVAPVRTNHLTYSEDFTQAAWLKASIGVAAGSDTLTFQGAGGSVPQYLYQVMSVLPGATYTLAFDVRDSTVPLLHGIYNETAGTWIVLDRATVTGAAGTWTENTLTFTVPAGCVAIRIYPVRVTSGSAVGSARIKNVRVNQGTAPLPYQRQTHGLLIDDSLRGTNMALTPDGFGSGHSNPALPTGWRYASDAPVSASVTAIRPNTSIPGTYEVDITATNSDTVTRAFRLYISPSASASDAVMVTAGDVVTLSAGLASNVTGNVSLNVYNYNAGRNFLANSSFSVNLAAGAPLARVGAARALTSDSTVVYALGVIEFALGAGASRSLTVHAPCFARGDIGLGYLRPPTHATLGSSAAAADSNDPTWGPTGMQFLGDDYASAPLPTADQMSWYVVAQQDVAPSNSGGNQVAFISKDVSGYITNPPFAVQLGPDLVPFSLVSVVPSNPPSADGSIASAGAGGYTITLGKPFGIGGTYDGKALRSFVGGRFRASVGTSSVAPTAALANTAGALRIGQQKLGSSRYMTGAVYLVLVWARALTDREMGQVDRAVREYLGRKGVQYDRI